MRLARWTIALVLAAACTIVAPFAPLPARADDADDRGAAARAALADLASPDDAVRAKAATQLADLGRLGATEIAFRGAELDDRAWNACAEAFVSARRSGCAFTLVSAARKAPEAHAKRLLALAHALDPIAGVVRTPDETATEVNRLLDESGRSRCATGYDEKIALLGRAALVPLLAGLRGGDSKRSGDSVSCSAVALLAEKEDLPAIRELVIAGRVNLVGALERMQRAGLPEATDALLDALAAGRLEDPVVRALAATPAKARVLDAVNAWIAGQPVVADPARANLAWLFAELDARESVPTLESWIATSKDPDTFAAIADPLTRFGSPRGVGLLVRIASERVTRFPCRPSTPAEVAAASAPGRLCPEGFSQWDRAQAAQKLSAIAGKQVFDVPEDWSQRLAAQGPDRESDDDHLDRAAAAFRTWWETSKDKLTFDPATDRWSVK